MPVYSTETEVLRPEFERLRDAWLNDPAVMVSSAGNFEHWAYQGIIRLGLSAVPLLLEECKKGNGHWGFALRMITGADPIHAEDAGCIDRIAATWVQWCKDQGYQV